MTSFDTPSGLLAKFRADADRHTGPEVPREIHGCAGCGRPWATMPEVERCGGWWCWPCRHKTLGGDQTGNGRCTEPTCPTHGGTTP